MNENAADSTFLASPICDVATLALGLLAETLEEAARYDSDYYIKEETEDKRTGCKSHRYHEQGKEFILESQLQTFKKKHRLWLALERPPDCEAPCFTRLLEAIAERANIHIRYLTPLPMP